MTNAYIIKVLFFFLKVICDKVNSVRMTLSLHNKAKQTKQTNKHKTLKTYEKRTKLQIKVE